MEQEQENEKWKKVKDYENLYLISNFGRIYVMPREYYHSYNKTLTKRKGKILNNHVNTKGYNYISLTKDNIKKNFLIHRLVAEHFISNPDNKPEVNHINGIKDYNYYKNLEWCTRSENMLHAFCNDLNSLKGEKNTQSKLTEIEVKEIRLRSNQEISLIQLAKNYNVSLKCIRNIINRKTWNYEGL